MEKVYSSKWLSGRALELSSGTVLRNPHNDEQCAGRSCPIHNPSDHPYRDFPLDFNGTNMVRVDPDSEGGVRIDPDDYEFNKENVAILRNSVECLNCETHITSEHKHDFVSCECRNVSVDGGHSYLKRSVRSSRDYKDTSIVVGRDL